MDSTRKEAKLGGLHLVCWFKLGNSTKFLQVDKLFNAELNFSFDFRKKVISLWHPFYNATNLHTKPAKFMRATFPSCLCMYLLVFSYLLFTYIVVNCKVYKYFFFLFLKNPQYFLPQIDFFSVT